MKMQSTEMFKNGHNLIAIQNFTKCLEMDEYNLNFNSIIYFNIAVIYDKMGKKADSLASLDLAIQLSPKYGKALVKRGDVFSDLAKFQLACDDYNRAILIDASAFNVQTKLYDAASRLKII